MEIPANCPLEREARRTVRLADQLNAEMRSLRRALRTCRTCPCSQNLGGCPLRRRLLQEIQAAISEIRHEWESD
jgi:hypothetical protein